MKDNKDNLNFPGLSYYDASVKEWVKQQIKPFYADSAYIESIKPVLTAESNKLLVNADTKITGNTELAGTFKQGLDTEATGEYSHAEGKQTTASGNYSHAEGCNNTVSSEGSHAEGYSNITSGSYSHTEGYGFDGNTGTGNIDSSDLVNTCTIEKITDNEVLAILHKYNLSFTHIVRGDEIPDGLSVLKLYSDDTFTTEVATIKSTMYNCGSWGNELSDLGYGGDFIEFSSIQNNLADGTYYYKVYTGAYGNYGSHSEGCMTVAEGIQGSHSEGCLTKAYGESSHAEGHMTTASGTNSHAEGCNTTASGYTSHAEGAGNTASGGYSHVEGESCIASGEYSHAEGSNSTASGDTSHAEGGFCTASGDISHAEGCNTTASGYTSHAEGLGSKAEGISSHAEGLGSKAEGIGSHASGIGIVVNVGKAQGVPKGQEISFTFNSGIDPTKWLNKDIIITNFNGIRANIRSITTGKYVIHIYDYTLGTTQINENISAIDENQPCIASGNASYAEGAGNTASGLGAHAEGGNNTASGNSSHAEGWNNTASGDCSHAEGSYTIANNKGEHSEGICNISFQDKTIHTVGIGELTKGKNAHEIHIDGKHYIYGIGGYDGTNSQTAGVKTLQEVINSKQDKLITEISWSDLKSKRDNGALIPGMQYRITDYVTTTIQADTQSAGHPFDVIVTADSTDVLNENARAIQHNGDEYFINSNLVAWQLWYCLDNDTNRFSWADSTNGKGVIYRMIDEYDNDCPYDFKNIQFKRFAITEYDKVPSLVVDNSENYQGYYYGAMHLDGASQVVEDAVYGEDFEWLYTFALKDLAAGTWHDYTVVANLGLKNDEGNEVTCFGNKLSECRDEYNSGAGNLTTVLNNVVFMNCYSDLSDTSTSDYYSYCNSNVLGDNCYSNTFGNDCYNNTFGNDCRNNTFGNHIGVNTFGNYFLTNTFGNYIQYINVQKDYVSYIIIENGNQNINITSSQTTSSSKLLRNFTISQGVNNTTTTKTISHNTVGDTFKTTYQPANSSVVNI